LKGSFAKVQPTIRIMRADFNILGIPIKIWDFGGQEQYRKEYSHELKYFERTNLLFYVVDIQDSMNFSESVEYFLDILQMFVMLKIKPHIFVLYHKSDPDLRDQPSIQKNMQMLRDLFLDLPEAMDITFHETSIYDYEQLSNVFVQGILRILPKGRIIQDVLQEFMKTTKASAIILLDENVLSIAEAFINEESRMTCHVCGPYFANMTDKLRKYNLFTPETIEVEMQGWLFFKCIDYQGMRLYLIFFTKEKENFTTINDLLPSFMEDLSNVLKFVL
jgi:GTPase SAR1 family protein